MSEHDENMTHLSELMEAIEELDRTAEVAAAIQLLPYSELTETAWSGVQRHQENVLLHIELLKSTILESSKLVGNDAVLAHITAVVTAD